MPTRCRHANVLSPALLLSWLRLRPLYQIGKAVVGLVEAEEFLLEKETLNKIPSPRLLRSANPKTC